MSVLSKEQIETKMGTLNNAKTERVKIETRKEELVKEIKSKYSVADGKELQTKITKLTEQKTELTAQYEVKCGEYEKLEEEAGLW
jgi:hypothetical protein